MKKFLALALAVIMTVGLVACGSDSGDTGTNPPAGGNTSDVNNPPSDNGGNSGNEGTANYKIGLMISPLVVREEYYRTMEMLVEEMGADKFVIDVYPTEPQNEQEVTISRTLNMAADPDVKAIIFDSADIGTIAAVERLREERPDIKVVFGSPNEDIYEMAEVCDLMLTVDPEGWASSVAQMAVDTGAEYFVFYSFARHMSNSVKVRHLEAMKKVCEDNGVVFEQVTMPDPMGDAGVAGAQQFILESVPSLMDQHGTKNIAYFATVSTIQEALLQAIVENGGIYPCHTDPSPFSAFALALGLEIPDDHTFDAAYVTDLITKKLADYDMNGRVGGWETSLVRNEMEFLFRYTIAWCEGETNEVDGNPDEAVVASLLKDIYTDSAVFQKGVNDTTGEEYDHWYTISRDIYLF